MKYRKMSHTELAECTETMREDRGVSFLSVGSSLTDKKCSLGDLCVLERSPVPSMVQGEAGVK